MGLRINTNVIALRAQRNLGSSMKALNRAMERLSSGSRINVAGDDAAGLAVSEGLRSQVRGLQQAIRNANDGIGFLTTAEGALAESTNIAQRIRELAIQAANGAISDNDRNNLDQEVQSLIEEFDRIATTTEFNGVFLLDGTFATTSLQVGIRKGQSIAFNIGNARSTVLGGLATMSGVRNQMTASTANLVINGSAIALARASDDTISSSGNSYSSVAIAKVINEKSGETKVFADVNTTLLQINNMTFSSYAGDLNTDRFAINGTAILGTGVSSVNQFINSVNNYSNTTGVKARLQSGSTDDIELYAEDGRNIQLQWTTAAATTGLYGVFTDAANYTAGFSTGTIFSTSTGYSAASNLVRTGSIKLRSASAITIQGSGVSAALGFSSTSIAVDNTNAIDSISVASQASASDSLALIDAALTQLVNLRADLGAVQNRLETGASRLTITSENLSAAQSQIRDADIAAETAELTRAQILQQAGIAILAQANVASQAALSLLQGGR